VGTAAAEALVKLVLRRGRGALASAPEAGALHSSTSQLNLSGFGQ